MEEPKKHHYSVTIEWSEIDNAYLARCPGVSGVSAFGVTHELALGEFQVSIELAFDEFKYKHPILFLSVEAAGLSVRATNALLGKDINTLGELVKLTRRELLRVRHMGKVSVEDIEKMLSEHGLRLKE